MLVCLPITRHTRQSGLSNILFLCLAVHTHTHTHTCRPPPPPHRPLLPSQTMPFSLSPSPFPPFPDSEHSTYPIHIHTHLQYIHTQQTADIHTLIHRLHPTLLGTQPADSPSPLNPHAANGHLCPPRAPPNLACTACVCVCVCALPRQVSGPKHRNAESNPQSTPPTCLNRQISLGSCLCTSVPCNPID